MPTSDNNGEDKNASNLFATHGGRPKFTGRSIVIMNDPAPTAIRSLSRDASLNIANSKDFSGEEQNFHEAFTQGDGIYFDTFKVAIVNSGNEEQLKALAVAPSRGGAAGTPAIITEPERFVYALDMEETATAQRTRRKAGSFADNAKATWGVQAIKALATTLTGKKINVAVLDTGLNLAHPDFARIAVQSKSFVSNQLVEDKNGHGTHCCGISVGAISKKDNRRYGVASGANLFAGKVLNNAGSGSDAGILAGVEWALKSKCKVISMSLGAEVAIGETFSAAYERVAKIALKNNCIIVAAAGNESDRPGTVKPVGHPANCPSVMAVAAIDNQSKVAWFSCGGLNPNGGQVDVAAPGVDIFSSWKSKKYNTISGTSMATPFVAGLAALYWEAFPSATAAEIWMKIMQNALRLKINSTDVGAGLVQFTT